MHQSGKDDEALAAYARALEADPRMLPPRLARAGLLLDLDRLDEAGSGIREPANTRSSRAACCCGRCGCSAAR